MYNLDISLEQQLATIVERDTLGWFDGLWLNKGQHTK